MNRPRHISDTRMRTDQSTGDDKSYATEQRKSMSLKRKGSVGGGPLRENILAGIGPSS